MIHFGAKEWDGPLSLHEMMEAKDPEILKYVQDYRIHLIDPSKLTKEELEKFSTSLREVLGYIKYSGDKKQLHSFTENNPRMRLDADAARVIRTVTNTPIEIREEEEEVDMCKAFTGVELAAGTHTVELRYYPQGLHEGLLISGGALFVLAVIWLLCI